MFVKNFNSIKRETVIVDDTQKKYLMDNGHSPISKNENGWVYIAKKDILNLLEYYKGGEALIE